MNNEERAAKIGKLLAKAERTDNPHEAETFTAAAERLMLQWGIEEAVARAASGDQVKPEEIIEVSIQINVAGYSRATITMVHRITLALGLRGFFIGNPTRGYTWYIVGHVSDVEKACWLINSLVMQAHGALATWWRTEGQFRSRAEFWTGADTVLQKKAFLVGFGEGASKQLREIRQEIIDDTPGAALVVVDRTKQVDDHMSENHKLKNSKTQVYSSAAGRAAGENADIGRSRVSGRLALG